MLVVPAAEVEAVEVVAHLLAGRPEQVVVPVEHGVSAQQLGNAVGQGSVVGRAVGVGRGVGRGVGHGSDSIHRARLPRRGRSGWAISPAETAGVRYT